MLVLTIECLCGNSFVVTKKVLEEALRHPSSPFVSCNQLIGTGSTSTICKRNYSAIELEKYIGRLDVIIVKDEKDVQLEVF
jgi:hypothetical protein